MRSERLSTPFARLASVADVMLLRTLGFRGTEEEFVDDVLGVDDDVEQPAM